MILNVKRLHEDAVIPQYAHEGDSGVDLVAVSDVIIEPGETVKVPTGLSFEIPQGFELQVRPRSGITAKTKLRVQLGTVDAGYRGEVSVIVDNIAQPRLTAWYTKVDGYVVAPETQGYLLTVDSDLEETFFHGADDTTIPLKMGYYRADRAYIIRKGDRIAQAVLAPVVRTEITEVDELEDSVRGANGFGSSGVSAD